MIRTLLAAVCALALSSTVWSDTVVLKDGKTLEGSIMKVGRDYRIKTIDGKTVTVREADVKQIIKSSPLPQTGAAGASTAAKPPAAAGSATPTPTSSASMAATRARADAVEAPILAVAIWERFIDTKPSPADLERAKSELAKWQQMQKENAEKINGKWVGGDERKALLKKVRQLIEEGTTALAGNQTVQGIGKLEEALKLYPNSFEANFGLGYFYLSKGAVGGTGRGNVQYMEKAVKSLETAAKIMPGSAATWSNLAIGYNFRGRYVDSVQAAYKAAKIEDSKEIVQNLVNSLAHAPRGMQTSNDKIKPIMEDAVLLARKHGIDLKGGNWHYIPPSEPKEGDAPADADSPKKPGLAGSGSGFVITADGYIITNRHVVAMGDPKGSVPKDLSFRVRFDDGTEKNVDLIAVDDNADIALLKVKMESDLPYLKIASDNPRQASKALVLGFPTTSMYGDEEMTLQISEGTVKSLHPGEYLEVWYDLNTTFGNSGGPIVDKNCRVVSILQGGRQVFNMQIVHGVGPLQIKRFLEGLGDKAPKAEYLDAGPGEFDGEKLTEEARKSTVLVLVIRGAPAAESAPSP